MYNGLLSVLGGFYILTYTHHQELMKSVGCQGRSSLLFVMKVMISHFVMTRKVITTLIRSIVQGFLYNLVDNLVLTFSTPFFCLILRSCIFICPSL